MYNKNLIKNNRHSKNNFKIDKNNKILTRYLYKI